MTHEIIKIEPSEFAPVGRADKPPAIVQTAGRPAMFAYAEFFEPELENDHTHRAYRYVINRFLTWWENRGLESGRARARGPVGLGSGALGRTLSI